MGNRKKRKTKLVLILVVLTVIVCSVTWGCSVIHLINKNCKNFCVSTLKKCCTYTALKLSDMKIFPAITEEERDADGNVVKISVNTQILNSVVAEISYSMRELFDENVGGGMQFSAGAFSGIPALSSTGGQVTVGFGYECGIITIPDWVVETFNNFSLFTLVAKAECEVLPCGFPSAGYISFSYNFPLVQCVVAGQSPVIELI